MTAVSSSLKATPPREIEEDPIAGLKRAQADYEAADAGFRRQQREILQQVFGHVSALIQDDETCRSFLNDKSFAQYARLEGDSSTDADRGDVWFRALAYVYRATSRAKRQRASKHASALRLFYQEDVDAEKVAATIEKRGGLQKLADEAAAKSRRRAGKKSATQDDAEPEEENGNEHEDAQAGDAEEEGADADQGVRFSISEKLTAKIRRYRGKQVKIIALVPREQQEPITVLRVVKLNTAER